MGRGLPGSVATKLTDRKASTMSQPTACHRARSCPDPSTATAATCSWAWRGSTSSRSTSSRGTCGGGRVRHRAPAGCPVLRGDRVQPWPARGAAGRRALLRTPGAAGLAQADLALRRAEVPGRVVDRAARRPRPTAGAAHGAGVLVGDRPDPSRARLGRRPGPPARHVMAHGVALDQAAAGAMAADPARFEASRPGRR